MSLEDFCPHISDSVSVNLRMESLLLLNNTPLTVGLLQLNTEISYMPASKEKKKGIYSRLSPMMDPADLPKRTLLWSFSFFKISYTYWQQGLPKHQFPQTLNSLARVGDADKKAGTRSTVSHIPSMPDPGTQYCRAPPGATVDPSVPLTKRARHEKSSIY